MNIELRNGTQRSTTQLNRGQHEPPEVQNTQQPSRARNIDGGDRTQWPVVVLDDRPSRSTIQTITSFQCTGIRTVVTLIFATVFNACIVIGFIVYDIISIRTYFNDFSLNREDDQNVDYQDMQGRNYTLGQINVIHSRYDIQENVGSALIIMELILVLFASLSFLAHKKKKRMLLLPWLVGCFPINILALVYSLAFSEYQSKSLTYIKVLVMIILLTFTANLFRIVLRTLYQKNEISRGNTRSSTATGLPEYSLPTIFGGEILMKPPPYEKDPPPYTPTQTNNPSSTQISSSAVSALIATTTFSLTVPAGPTTEAAAEIAGGTPSSCIPDVHSSTTATNAGFTMTDEQLPGDPPHYSA